jgi:hypothetical protein
VVFYAPLWYAYGQEKKMEGVSAEEKRWAVGAREEEKKVAKKEEIEFLDSREIEMWIENMVEGGV